MRERESYDSVVCLWWGWAWTEVAGWLGSQKAIHAYINWCTLTLSLFDASFKNQVFVNDEYFRTKFGQV